MLVLFRRVSLNFPNETGCAKGAALLSTDLVKVRELLSFPFRTPTVKKTFGTEKDKGKNRPKNIHFAMAKEGKDPSPSEVKKSLK